MSKKVRWGILGAATIAKEQMIPAIECSKEGMVFAIASKSAKVEQLAADFNIPKIFRTYEELIQSEDVDAIYIALPNSLHKEWIEKAVSAGKHVLCEKPIVLEESELISIFKLANERNVHVMEAFMYRFHPQVTEVKKMLNAGAIGQLLTIRSRFHFTIENMELDIRMQPNLGGGVVRDIGCYSLNAILEFVGENPDKILSMSMSGRSNHIDTHVSFQLGFPSGVIGIADCSFHGPMTQGIDIIGTDGIINMPYIFRSDLNDDRGTIELQINGESRHYNFIGNSYVHQVDAFQEAVLGNSELPYTQQQMIQHIRILQEIVTQLKSEGVDTIGTHHIRT